MDITEYILCSKFCSQNDLILDLHDLHIMYILQCPIRDFCSQHIVNHKSSLKSVLSYFSLFRLPMYLFFLWKD